MRLWLAFITAVFLIAGLGARGQEINIGPCNDTVGVGQGVSIHPCAAGGNHPFTPSCQQAADFLARVSGFSVSDKSQYDDLICALEAGNVGCSNSLDALYVFAAPNEAAALLNLCGTSGTLTKNGSVTFTPYRGLQGDGSSGYLSNTVQPHSGYTKYLLNSASAGGCIVNSRTSPNDGMLLGVTDAVSETIIFPLFGSSNIRWNLNHGSGLGTATGQSNAQGLYHLTRIDGSNVSIYKSGASIALNSSMSADSIPTLPFYFGATNNNGSPANFSSDQIAMAFIGRGMTGGEVNTFYTLWGVAYASSIGLTGC